jgi:lysophospholipase L1-like esterase
MVGSGGSAMVGSGGGAMVGSGGSAMVGSGGSQISAGGGSGGSGMETEPPVFAPCPSDGTPCRIMPLGDSITDGVGSQAQGGGGYRVELFRQAIANQQNITFVGLSVNGPANVTVGMQQVPLPRNHEGHSGFTISGGGAGSLAGLVDNAIAQTDPNIILLMIGTNDVNQNINLGQAPQRLGALLDQIIDDAPDALLVVAQIIPITMGGGAANVQPYNGAIPGLVQARADAGNHVILVDMFTPFNSTPNFAAALMNDFLHPNPAGYVVMAQTWYEAIDEFLPTAP